MLRELFPDCITESKEGDKVVLSVDFDALRQDLSDHVVEGPKERYQFTWPDKNKARVLANTPTTNTLRPCREESVDFDTTKNLYIEGDNLEVLKILRETYLGKVKMIYIDPPYNTGNDFIYRDDFSTSAKDYSKYSGDISDIGERLFRNSSSDGRFHTKWLNMMYSRLLLARDFLKDDGIIFISISDTEVANLIKIMDEVFGETNFICNFIWEKTVNPNSTSTNVGIVHEYILCYSRSETELKALSLSQQDYSEYKGHDEYENERGPYKLVGLNKTGTVNDLRPNLTYEIYAPDGSTIKPNPRWRWSEEKFIRGKKEGRVVFNKTGDKWTVYYKQYLYEDTEGNKISRGSIIKTLLTDCGRTTNGTTEINKILGKGYFDFPKPTSLIERLISITCNHNDIILDFFSGSSTTADAIFKFNLKTGNQLNFILVQVPETIDTNSTAYKDGFKNICEIGEERIRRSGIEIKKLSNSKSIDVGFRVFKLSSSNTENLIDVPKNYNRRDIGKLINLLKHDRSSEDLLIQVMLELGIELSSKIKEVIIDDIKTWIVDDGYLVAITSDKCSESAVTHLAKIKPSFAVFRNDAGTTDQMLSNIEQIFKTYSPGTTLRLI